LSTFLVMVESGEGELLYTVHFEQALETSFDLAFNDDMLIDVKAQWNTILGKDAEQASFMKFEDRHAIDDDDEFDG
jgi:hypothetical protein